ncbi:MAG: MATE family efflux transporter [Clostridia bacterium]|nr:MATE family efflux transporter [Clostridia bacterium]
MLHIRKRRTTYEIDMLNGPLLSKIIRFSVVLTMTNVLQLLYSAADLIVIGRFSGSETAVAAVGATNALVSLIVNFFIGLSVGVSVLVARGYGTGNRKSVEQVVHTSMTVALICGLIVMTVGLCFSKTFLVWMGTSEAILDQSTLYLMIYFIGAPFNTIYNFGASILRSTGDTKRPFYFLSLAGLVNVVLNLIFVCIFHMDVAGVAIATVVSQMLSAVLILICLMKQDGMCRFEIRKMRIHGEVLGEILRIGLPASIQNTLFSISAVMVQSSVNFFDVTYAAPGTAPYTSGSSAANNIEGFVYTSLNSFQHAAMSFTGQNYAAGKYNRTRKILHCCIFSSLIVALVLGGAAILFGKQLLSIYVPGDAEAIAYGYQRLVVLCSTYALCGFMEVLVGQLRGLGRSMVPMLISVIGICGLRVFWISVVFAMTHDWIILFLSYPVSWIITIAAQFISYYLIQRKLPKHDMDILQEQPI